MASRYISSTAGAPFLSLHTVETNAASDTTLALDSAYGYASAGDAFFATFISSETGNLTDFWVKIAGYTGAWGSTDGVINVEIREDTNGSNIPGTTLAGSFTVALNGTTTGWIKKSGLSIALTAGKTYCAVIGDADGSASNYVTVARHSSYTGRNASLRQIVASTVSATNGFATAGTNTTGQPYVVFRVAGQLYSGGGVSSISTIASGTYERGLRFSMPDNCVLAGVAFIADYAVPGNTLKLYADATGPGGATLMSFTVPPRVGTGTSPQPVSFFFPEASAVSLTAGVWYRFTLDPTTAQTTPRKAVIGGSPDADVLAACQPLGGNCYWTQESGSTWADETNAMILMSPILILNTDAGGGTRAYGSVS